MNEQILIDDVCRRMIAFDRGDAKRIQHFLKVHAYARLIAHGEKVDTKTQRIIELAALVHDIGIHPAEEKYGRCDGKLQEQEGPAPARALLAATASRGSSPITTATIQWMASTTRSSSKRISSSISTRIRSAPTPSATLTKTFSAPKPVAPFAARPLAWKTSERKTGDHLAKDGRPLSF